MSGSKTIAKNTLFLYFRMLLVMAVSLFTSRIVLRELGVSDYGVYSLVGGIVAMFGFFNSAMSSATQRYLSFDIGKANPQKLQKTFSATLTIHTGIAVLVLILAETLGLWYINYKMVFPPERTFAVNVVYQFSILSFLLGIIQVPYNALIIARERMNVYAYVSVLEVSLKLIIVFLLVYFGSDKLITYAILTFLVSFIIRIVYQVYCRRNFKESKYRFEYDKTYYRELMSYSGWNLFGNIAAVARGQGNNIVLNLFFGVIANAAYGITMVVQGAVSAFITNFMVAVNPQITKTFAKGDLGSMHRLINRSSKFSFLLALLLISPIILHIEFILKLWLVNPPKFSAEMISVALLCMLVDTLSGPLMTGIQATGKIKSYQAVVGILVFLNLPISYLILKFNLSASPVIIFKVWLGISLVSLFLRLYYLKIQANYSLRSFFKEVLLQVIGIAVLSYSIGYGVTFLFEEITILNVIIQSILYLGVLVFAVYFLILNQNEKQFIHGIGQKFIQKFKNSK